ncbi:hypothetical protein KIPB_000149 [Kipferlia bialata]|uniref:Uncharacterized protein n=1 Tax=Kipferlia bialata TaxID=797122 RepID=A0A9K3GD85_9EUKA|nr:hypothetical protein KIPB_000149 [Kipferlia bialata]|eukprot:g149.t1
MARTMHCCARVKYMDDGTQVVLSSQVVLPMAWTMHCNIREGYKRPNRTMHTSNRRRKRVPYKRHEILSFERAAARLVLKRQRGRKRERELAERLATAPPIVKREPADMVTGGGVSGKASVQVKTEGEGFPCLLERADIPLDLPVKVERRGRRRRNRNATETVRKTEQSELPSGVLVKLEEGVRGRDGFPSLRKRAELPPAVVVVKQESVALGSEGGRGGAPPLDEAVSVSLEGQEPQYPWYSMMYDYFKSMPIGVTPASKPKYPGRVPFQKALRLIQGQSGTKWDARSILLAILEDTYAEDRGYAEQVAEGMAYVLDTEVDGFRLKDGQMCSGL